MMRFFKFILFLNIFCTVNSYSEVHENRLIDNIDMYVGMGWDLVSFSDLCSWSDANLDEYRQVRCGIKIDGRLGYQHEGDELWTSDQFSPSYMQQFTDNIVFQSAALDVYQFNTCERDYFAKMSEGSQRLENLKNAAYPMFLQVKDQIKELDGNITQRMSQMESEVAVHVMSVKPSSDYRILNSLENSAEENDPRRNQISELASVIPLGNRPQMRAFIVLASNNNYGAAAFKAGYESTVRTLGAESDNNLALVKERVVSYDQNQQPLFEVDNSWKKSLFKNGVIDNILAENEIEGFSNSNYMCRYRSQLRGQEVRLWIEMAAAAALMPATGGMTGYAITTSRLGVILSRSSAIRGVAGFASRATAPIRNSRVGRLVLTGSYGTVDFGLSALEAKRECFTPEYVAGKSSGSCNAEKQYDLVVAEASATTCMLGLSVTALTGISLTKSFQKAARTPTVSNTSSVGRVVDEAPAETIVVSGSRGRRQFAIDSDTATSTRAELSARGFDPQTKVLNTEELASLTPTQRAVFFEDVSGTALNSRQLSRLEDLFEKIPRLSEKKMRRKLRGIISAGERGLSRSDLDEMISKLERSGVLGR